MAWQSEGISLAVHPAAGILLALLLMTLPLNWLLAWLMAAVWHEICHVAAVLLLGERVESITLGLLGAQIRTVPLSPGRGIFCALAGPLGGLALVLLWRWFPRIALCALAQSAVNLLPVYPLDGGQALKTFLEACLPRGGVIFSRVDRFLTFGLILTLILLKNPGGWPIALALGLVAKKKTLQKPASAFTI